MSRDWPRVDGVIVTASVARWLRFLAASGRRQVERERLSMPPDVRARLAAIDALAEGDRAAEGPVTPDERPTMRVADAAALLGVSERRVRALVTEGKLRGRKVAGVWRVDRDDVALRLPDPAEPLGTPSESAS